ncbi:MAG: NADH-quinone oxidoreductase subunit N [Bdellovibrionales bacterium]
MIDFSLIAPELFIAASGLVLLLFSVCRREGHSAFFMTTVLSALVMAAASVWVGVSTTEGSTLHDFFVTGPFQHFVKSAVLGLGALAALLSPFAFGAKEKPKPEYGILLLFSVLGMMLMASANDLIGLYVALELQNLPLYVLVSLRRGEPQASEAGLKYFALGATASAILLFGLSFVYGFAGTTSFAGIAGALAEMNGALPVGLWVGGALTLVGLAFKISAVPFHMWTPDVYQGAATPVTAFLSSAPKVAGVGLLALVLARPFTSMEGLWLHALVVLSVLSMLVGALGGLRQTNVKRLMGYSAILNIGTMLIGLVVMGKGSVLPDSAVDGARGAFLYVVLYAVGTVAFLGSLSLLGRRQKPLETLEDLAGLASSQPFLTCAMAAALFSLAGVPPLAGFFGKYFVLLAAVQGGFVWLAVLGVLTSVIAAAYYLRIVKVMVFDEPKGLPVQALSGRIPSFLMGVVSLSLVLFVLCPSFLIEAARHAAEGLVFR